MAMMDSHFSLLPSQSLRQVSHLMLMPKRLRAGAMRGERRSKKRGTSIEFADYRNYSAGDDLRKLDWNILARLNKPVVKVHEDEEDLTVHLLCDASLSMQATEEGETSKWDYSTRLASLLAFVALNAGDALTTQRLGETDRTFKGRGREGLVPFLRWMGQQSPQGQTDLNASLQAFTAREKRVGLCFIFTDLFSPMGYETGLRAMLAKGHEVVLVHTLAPSDITPPVRGDVRLIDVETLAPQELTIDAPLYARYQAHLHQWQEGIRATCARWGVHYVHPVSSTPPERLLLSDLLQLGLVK